MEYLDLSPISHIAGTVDLPGSKSISNRTLLLAALSLGETQVKGLLASDDTQRMLEAMATLGVKWEQIGASRDFLIHGCGGDFPIKQADLFLGNAGTAFRPLTAALALAGGTYKLTGVARMHERPIGDLIEALRQAGAQIDYLGVAGYPPLQIRPGQITGNRAAVKGHVSSQFLTSLLMALPLTGRDFTIEVIGELISKPYIEITLNLLKRFGIQIERNRWDEFFIPGNQTYTSPGEIFVEGDASSASYFLAAGAISASADKPVKVTGVGKQSIQGDVRFAEALAAMGAVIEYGDNWISASMPTSGKLKAISMDFNHIPDAAMTIAVAALFAEGTTTLRNIASWRVKETDRLTAMATELRKVGATVEEGQDYLVVTPPAKLIPNAAIATYDDHRMAMCFSLVSLATPVRILDPGCTAKTFPTYFDELARISG